MRLRSIGIAVSAVLFFALAGTSPSQSLNGSLSQLSEPAAIKFIQPGFDPFGMAVNGGWLDKPPKPSVLDFDLELGIVAMGTFVQRNAADFEVNTLYRFSASQAATIADRAGITDPSLKNLVIDAIIAKDFPVLIYGPTVVGSKDRSVKVVFSPNGTEILQINDPRSPVPVYVSIPLQTIDLENVTGVMNGARILPSTTLQLKLGTLYGTQAILRFFPSVRLMDDLGNYRSHGFGLQHNPNAWLKFRMPVDVSIGFLLQKVHIGDAVDVNGASYGINVSKTFGARDLSVTPYLGALLEHSSIDVHYSEIAATPAGREDVNINFNLIGSNKSRFTVGARFHITIVDLTVDYNIGKMNSITSGLFFTF